MTKCPIAVIVTIAVMVSIVAGFVDRNTDGRDIEERRKQTMAEKEYIERGALLQEDFTECWNDITDQSIFEHIIEQAPVVDVVEVRHGEWIEHIVKPDWLEDDVEVYYNCSVCGSSHWSIEPPYCPNCGAKMDGERKCANE